jgi:hypothetical protein
MEGQQKAFKGKKKKNQSIQGKFFSFMSRQTLEKKMFSTENILTFYNKTNGAEMNPFRKLESPFMQTFHI